jgi:hypothetical protein
MASEKSFSFEEARLQLWRKRVEAQFANAHGFSWLKTPREIEVYKMGLRDAFEIMEDQHGK